MRLRSLLFVPGDRPERIEKAFALGADALILDLEDSVAVTSKDAARATIAARLDARRPTDVPIFVRINPLESHYAATDIAMIARHRPDGIVLPKADGARSIRTLVAQLDSAPPILPIAAETPAAIFQFGSYAEVSQYMCGLAWGGEDLSAAVGARSSRNEAGQLRPPFEMARAQTLFAAYAAGVAAIETVYPDFRANKALAEHATKAAYDGFTGMMAIHPSQIESINVAFTPTAEQIAQARSIVDAFTDNPGAGALQINGRMIDAPHLKHARTLLARV